jgi:RNA polymerase sigma-70 factor (ECF subfamily)
MTIRVVLAGVRAGMNVELVSRAAAGEWDSLRERDTNERPETRFALLVERQSRFVFRVAYAVLRNVDDAEDVVQDTFLKLFRTGAWKNIENEQAFLARTAWRLAITKKPLRRFGLRTDVSEIACSNSSPERAAIEAEGSRRIHRLIDALPEKLRRPLALSSIEGMTTSQVAALMDLPESTVRRLVAEARALLKDKIARMESSKHE